MNTLGCCFCDKFGNVSALNQHVRSFLDASRTGRHMRGSDHHNIEIVQAFYNLTAQRQDEFIESTSTDRLAVLNEFARHITKHLKSDTETAQWKRRDFYPRRAAWWARQITIVLDMYCASGRLPQLLSAHVQNVIQQSIAESLMNVDDDDDDERDNRPRIAATLPQKLTTGLSDLFALPGVSGVFMPAPPAPQTDLTMQYSGSQHGNRLGKASSINKLTRKWINNLSTIENATAKGASTPKIHLRKRGGITANYAGAGGAGSRSTEYVTISDEEQDDELAADQGDNHMLRMQQVGNRGPPTATRRAFSSTLPGSRTTAGKSARSVSDGVIASSSGTVTKMLDLADAEPDGMSPFVLLHVTGLTNTVQSIAIPFAASLDGALALAIRFAPRVVRENNLPVRFVGHEGSEWGGDWPEWRWEQLMTLAKSQKVELGLRLIMAE